MTLLFGPHRDSHHIFIRSLVFLVRTSWIPNTSRIKRRRKLLFGKFGVIFKSTASTHSLRLPKTKYLNFSCSDHRFEQLIADFEDMHSFFSRFVLLWCVCSAFSYAYRNSLGWRRLRTTERYCVDKVLTPINRFPEEGPSDSDSSWRTAPSTIIPIDKEKFEVRPDLITFDACNTLIQPSQSVGKWYREALNSACNMQIRLPRPAFFTASFERSFKEM